MSPTFIVRSGMKKTCTSCLKDKDVRCFYRKSGRSGYGSKCKDCLRDRYEKTRLTKSSYDRDRYQANRRSVIDRQSRYYRAHKDEKREYDKSIRSRVMANRRKRYRTDLNYKLTCNLRSRLYSALRRSKQSRSVSTSELLGCSIEDFKRHIESRFTEGMDWEKVHSGEIHIDHIIPCVAFDLTDKEQQRKCFHFSNLQPLWAVDNHKKYTKYSGKVNELGRSSHKRTGG